jgi:hypothetical protein
MTAVTESLITISIHLEVMGDFPCNLDTDNKLYMNKFEFDIYCGSPRYHSDLAEGLSPSSWSASTLIVSGEFAASEF